MKSKSVAEILRPFSKDRSYQEAADRVKRINMTSPAAEHPIDRSDSIPSDSIPSDNTLSDGILSDNSPTNGILSDYQADYQTPKNNLPRLADIQLRVLTFLINKQDKRTCASEVAIQINAKVPSVRHALSCLVRDGWISKPVTVRQKGFQGFTYFLNTDFCNALLRQKKVLDEAHINYQTPYHARLLSDLTPSDSRPSSSSLKSLDLKPTTKAFDPVDLEYLKSEFETDPELEYWRGKGLTVQKVASWAEEFAVPGELILQSLCFARFDLAVRGLEADQPVINPVSWFYGALRRSKGVYTKPEGYRTFQEIAIEEALRLRAKKKEDTIRLMAERRAVLKAEFDDFYDQPESDQYQKCFELIPEVMRGLVGEGLKRSMLCQWYRLNGIRGGEE